MRERERRGPGRRKEQGRKGRPEITPLQPLAEGEGQARRTRLRRRRKLRGGGQVGEEIERLGGGPVGIK